MGWFDESGVLMKCGLVRFQMHVMEKMSGGHTSVLENTVSLKGGCVPGKGCGTSRVINLPST